MTVPTVLLALLSSYGAASVPMDSTWQPKDGPLMTKWAKDVKPDRAHPEYPRPQLVRKDWLNLNGLWDYRVEDPGTTPSEAYDGKILVPFPIESALSGVMKMIGYDSTLRYHRTFEVPKGWHGKRVLVHFGAVDYDSTVFVNGTKIGRHLGGYDVFSYDITDALKEQGPQELVVAVQDHTDPSTQPRGKQIRNPEGILYTPTTGIWQTVWLEPVAQKHIEGLLITPNVDKGSVTVQLHGSDLGEATVEVKDGSTVVATGKGVGTIELKVPNAKLWTPDHPHLYDLSVSVHGDHVGSYFGMRKIAIGKDKAGVNRIMLNNEPIFMLGPLDQGFWPDGIYTAPTDEALKYDIEVTKHIGMNMARKHVKVEPDRWYYWCDKLGLMVWQDMPSAWGNNDDTYDQFKAELTAMVKNLVNHPSIVVWVPFNEGWGQFRTEEFAQYTKQLDPTRLVNNASGWTDKHVGDVVDWHVYPGPGAPDPDAHRASVLGEFGGLGLQVHGHMWKKDGWGYQSYGNSKDLTDRFIDLMEHLKPLRANPGLCAAVYTQTTDCEQELNGIMTYDRAMLKMDEARITAAIKSVYAPPPTFREVVPTSRKSGIPWHCTTEKPADTWSAKEFDDSSWATGPGGFGTEGTPGAVVRTEWKTADIWLRRTFEIPKDLKWHSPQLIGHHDEDAEVYIDGELVAKMNAYTTGYGTSQLKWKPSPGKHTLAVHCHQTEGGQYIDMGIVDIEPAKKP